MKKHLGFALVSLPGGGFARPWRPRLRPITLLLVALITMLSATVALGQAAQDFDLACRSLINGGGGISASGSFGVLATIGQPIAPADEASLFPTYSIRNGDFGLRAGFLPGYPTRNPVATNIANPEETHVNRLPIIYNILRIVRGGC